MILGCGRANSNWRVSVAYTQTSVDLASISCPSSSDCIAVGGEQYENHPSGMEEAVIYDSGVWKLLKVNGLRRQDEVLVGSSCTRVLSCIAVGSVLGQNGSTQDGGWIVRISGHSGTSLTEIQGKLHFTGIACTSHTHCLVTGVRFTPNPVPLLEETFDARINSALKEARQVATTPRQGRCTGSLLAKANGPSTVDALVMARALLSGGPATIATSDKGDFDQLLSIAGDSNQFRSGAARVTVLPVWKRGDCDSPSWLGTLLTTLSSPRAETCPAPVTVSRRDGWPHYQGPVIAYTQ